MRPTDCRLRLADDIEEVMSRYELTDIAADDKETVGFAIADLNTSADITLGSATFDG